MGGTFKASYSTAISPLGDFPRCACGVGRDDRLGAELAEEVAALAERHGVALDGLDLGQPHLLEAQQLIADGQEPLGYDMQPGARHQVMDVGDPPGD